MPSRKQPFRDVLVVLPGILGSVLEKSGESLWDVDVSRLARLALRPRILRDLTLASDDAQDGVVATRLIDDLHLIPGFWKIDGYSTLRRALLGAFELEPGSNYFELPYDWRRDNRIASEQLDRKSHGWLKEWQRRSGNGGARLVLVAHSMGGLVARHFLECREGWKRTRALVTFATPYRGSLNALDTLANGARQALGLVDLSDFARSCTSIHQLLPTYPCVDPGDGSVVRVAETDVPNVDRARAAAALAFHDEIAKAQSDNAKLDAHRVEGYRIHPIVGLHQSTHASARVTDDGVVVSVNHRDVEIGGDGTVPRVSAIPLEMSEAPTAAYFATKHASLQNAEAALVHLYGILTGASLDLGAFRDFAVPLSLDVPDVVAPGEPVPIRVAASVDDLTLDAVVRTDGRDGQRVRLALMDGEYVGTLSPLPDGAHEIRVEGEGAQVVQDAFLVASPVLRAEAMAGSVVGAAAASETRSPAPFGGPAEALGADDEGDPGGFRSIDGDEDDTGEYDEGGEEYDDGGDGGVAAEAETEEAPSVPVVLSADAPDEVRLAETASVRVRIEHFGPDAAPLRHHARAEARPEVPVDVYLRIDGEALGVVGAAHARMTLPTAGRASEASFTIAANVPGAATIGVDFFQAGARLGSIAMQVTSVLGAASDRRATATVEAEPQDADEVLELLVRPEWTQRTVIIDGVVHSSPPAITRYSYYVNWRAKDVVNLPFASRPFEEDDTKDLPLAFVRRKTAQLTKLPARTPADQQALQNAMEAAGVDLCEQLFDEDMRRFLWESRNDIRTIQISPLEPHVPWELVRLTSPDGEVDDRFLADYGLVRRLPTRGGGRRLGLKEWRFVGAKYPHRTHDDVGAEMAYFRGDKAPKPANPVDPDPNELFNLLKKGDFDVLHVACHGTAPKGKLDSSELVLSDAIVPGQGVTDRRLAADQVAGIRPKYGLKPRGAVVFLNACDTGKNTQSLTDWRGWPVVFNDLGALVFVGTSWPVREQPASAFAEAFYDALRQGQPLWRAATAGRDAAKASNEASWLAFAVYGPPAAAKA